MNVFKFGGASLKDAHGIRNVGAIIQSFKGDLVVVVSAMGKTTNALENIVDLCRSGKSYQLLLSQLKQYHTEIMEALFTKGSQAFHDVDAVFEDLEKALNITDVYDQVYDQVVSKGEIISSVIMHHYLCSRLVVSVWLDARKLIVTDRNFREGRVNWPSTTEKIQALKWNKNIFITQGFIGSTEDGLTTTLGREGSDFSAAIFASCLEADAVTIWKDVPGVMSADPKRISNAVVFEELPFKEAAEMTYYGASVIHPKTIKPLANKGIPLFVKNFDDPSRPGTKIHECHIENLPPLIVFKENQCLVSCKVTDYTFISEEQMGIIFHVLSALDLHINVMQNSAISFSFCIDFRANKVSALIEKLQQHFEVYYNTGLTLVTIKNYDETTFERYRKQPEILMEQSSRSTLQVLLKS